MDTVPRISTLSRVWLPVIVPPMNTRVVPVVVNVPGTDTNVQLWLVRKMPVPGPAGARVRLPEGLLMVTLGRSPARTVWKPVTVWLPAPLMSRVAVPPVKPAWTSTSAWAASVPPFRTPLNRFT